MCKVSFNSVTNKKNSQWQMTEYKQPKVDFLFHENVNM
jgi:hypothetical protein